VNVLTYDEFLKKISVQMQELHFASAGDITWMHTKPIENTFLQFNGVITLIN